MTLVIAQTRRDNGVLYNLNPLDDIRVDQGISLMSQTDAAIVGTSSFQTATISGSVYGKTFGIRLGDSQTSDHDNKVVVTTGGSVNSDIFAGVYSAIEMFCGKSQVLNKGTISGIFGISLGGIGAGQSQIINDGRIDGTVAAIYVIPGATEKVFVTNNGTISGFGQAFSCGNRQSAAVIVNHGVINGAISFGVLGDVYDGHDGRISSSIYGDRGNDRFLPGEGSEVIDGGDDMDTLDFRSGPGIRIALDNSLQATGRAKGDTYTAMENILGSVRGNDTLRGNDDANRLSGNGGNDQLAGSDGADWLEGGAGRDRLTGGLDGDRFIFTQGSGADVITDFNASQGDEIALRGVSFGLQPGDLAAARFHSSTTNQAHDRDDRLIFRTTDATLWFDADGRGGKGPVLMADFQAGAVVTAGDIFLI